MATSSYHPRLAVSGISTFRWTVEEELAFYGDAGITRMGVLLMKEPDDLPGVVAKVQGAGMTASSVVASVAGVNFLMLEGGPAGAVEALQPSIDAGRDLGGAPCYFTTGRPPKGMSTDDAYDLLVPLVADVVEYSRSQGVRLALEHNSTALRDNGFVNSFADAVDLSHDTGLDICVEIQNAWFERHLRQRFADNVDRIVIVQVSDFVVGETTRMNRAVPGDGDIPLEWMLGALLDAGYSGPFELELIGPRIEEEGYDKAILRGLEWLSERFTRWGV